MEDWAIALIAVGCAVAAGLIVGLSVYAVLDKRRKRRGNHDPFNMADGGKSDQTDAASQQFAHTATSSIVASRNSLALDPSLAAPRLPNQPYQRYSLSIGDYAPKILGGTLIQPAQSQVTTVPARGYAHYSSFYTPQIEATFPPPKNLPIITSDLHRFAKNAKARRPEHFGSETDLYAAYNAPNFQPNASPAASFVYSAAQSFVSDSGIRANSTLSTEPIYQQRKSQTPTQLTAALKSESAMKKDRKDSRKWNSLGNLNESEGEAEFSDPKLLTGANHGMYGQLTGSAQPYSYAPFVQRNARPPSFKHYSKYNEEQLYYNAAQVIEQARINEWKASNAGRVATELDVLKGPLNSLADAQHRAKHSSLVVTPTYQSAADSDLLALNRGGTVTSTNWETRAKVQGVDGLPSKNAAAMSYTPELHGPPDQAQSSAKPLARILPNANATEPVYSKLSKASDQHTFSPIRNDSANPTPTPIPTPDVAVAVTLSKTHTPVPRNVPSTPVSSKAYPETPTRDLQAVTEAFDFLNAMNV